MHKRNIKLTSHTVFWHIILLFLTTGLAPAPASATVYIALGSANEVIAVDPQSDTITARYPGVENPHGLVATPDGEYLIAGSLTEKPAGEAGDMRSQLFLIHPAHGHVMATIPVVAFSHHEAITPDGRYVISTHPTKGGISVVDMNERRMVRFVETGAAPNYTLVSKDGKHIYVSNSGAGTISEIDTGDWTVKRQLEAGPGPEHMAFSLDGNRIYVVNPGAGKVSEVVVDSGKVVRSFETGSGVHAIDLSDDGKTLFASQKKTGKLIAIELGTGDQKSVALEPAPYHLTSIHGTGKIYVSSRKKPVIWVVDQNSLKSIGRIDLESGEGHQATIATD